MKISHKRHSANSSRSATPYSRATIHYLLFTIHEPVVLSALMLFFSLFSVHAFAQTTQSGLAPTLPSASAASYYYIAKPGELTMPVRPDCRPGGQVNVWGFVKNPGRY